MERRRAVRRVGVAASVATGAVVLAALAGCGSGVVRRSDDVVRGKQLFVAKCGSCHTLARAGTKGTVGPNFDDAFRESLKEGFGRSVVRAVVIHQILYPARGQQMPAQLVTGQKADDIGAYIASVVDRTGSDQGLLATAVKQAGAGKPAVATGGTLQIDADPSGQLAFVTNTATASAGSVTFKMANQSSSQHNIAIKGPVTGTGQVVSKGGVSTFTATLKPGTYEFYCQVPGHEAGGMKGTLVVK